MNLRTVVLSARNPTRKNSYSMIPFRKKLQKMQMNLVTKQINGGLGLGRGGKRDDKGNPLG